MYLSTSSYIFVTGGVVSSLGKGVVAAAIGRMLKSRGIKVSILKLDPYLNVDPGTMSPYQHGEVFVTTDGLETDLDLGHYERFIDLELRSQSSITAGQIYRDLIDMERQGQFLGGTIQTVPHLTGEIKRRIRLLAQTEKADVVLVEVGGTVGDIEGEPFIEAIRQMKTENENVVSVHLTLVPHLNNGELKTKPTQHSVRTMRSMGLQPDLILCRSEFELDDVIRQKISLHCDVEPNEVVWMPSLESIYEAPLLLEKNGVGELVLNHLGIKSKPANLEAWFRFTKTAKKSVPEVEIAVVGKYVELHDAYISVEEALKHAAWNNEHRLKINWIKSSDLESVRSDKDIRKLIGKSRGILVPGGFGKRGILGMVEVARYAREKNIPYFGICLGMQVMVIEFARNVLGLSDADSSEFNEATQNPVVHLMHEQGNLHNKGATMRLGHWLCKLEPGTLAHKAYQTDKVNERHRHRYEINDRYVNDMQKAGMSISGVYEKLGLAEIAELKGHPFFLGSQFHPEFASRPDKVHPLFNAFIKAAINRMDRQTTFQNTPRNTGSKAPIQIPYDLKEKQEVF